MLSLVFKIILEIFLECLACLKAERQEMPAHLKDYSDPCLWMELLEFKNIILEMKLSNKFKIVNESFLFRDPRKYLGK
jgi:hypothetical protein